MGITYMLIVSACSTTKYFHQKIFQIKLKVAVKHMVNKKRKSIYKRCKYVVCVANEHVRKEYYIIEWNHTRIKLYCFKILNWLNGTENGNSRLVESDIGHNVLEISVAFKYIMSHVTGSFVPIFEVLETPGEIFGNK